MSTARVVLLHGLGGSPAVWQRVLPLLAPGTEVVAPALVHPTRIEDDAAAVAALLEGQDGPGLVVGHSRGGLVATALAERHPHLVSQVVVVNSPPTTASRNGSAGERALALPALGPLLWRVMPRSAAARGLGTAFAPGHGVPEVFVDDLRATGRGPFVAASRAIDRYLGERPLPERLAALGVPVHVVLGSRDQRLDLGAYAAEPSLRRTTLPAAGHTPPWEAPDEVAALITSLTSAPDPARHPEDAR
ncbi:MAG: putative hydrolase, alpha/beta hydrolase family [Marmoricola sp.]|nr:putative hydrolase, alpha/beta hydrolase family [Marmoricola sp.]